MTRRRTAPTLRAMSRIHINRYLAELDRTRKFSGSLNEEVIREAFKGLLRDWSRDQNLFLQVEYAMQGPQRNTVKLDGAVLHELRVPLGYWEAKDTADDLDREIEKKLRKGYPQDNILFEDSVTAVLIQIRVEGGLNPHGGRGQWGSHARRTYGQKVATMRSMG